MSISFNILVNKVFFDFLVHHRRTPSSSTTRMFSASASTVYLPFNICIPLRKLQLPLASKLTIKALYQEFPASPGLCTDPSPG